jgi:hypothetical protein
MKMPPRLSLILWAGLVVAAPKALAQGTEAADKEVCKRHLHYLHDAIQAYREANKELPDKLSDLVGRYLGSRDYLTCPTARKRNVTPGDLEHYKPSDILDPKTTYLYEFSRAPIPSPIPGGRGKTMREFKRRQMALVGGRVPIVRCLVHDESINLGFDGEVYESASDWELLFVNVVKPAELTAASLFAEGTTLKVISLPARDTNTPAGLLDLTEFYNGSLKRGADDGGDNNLAELPAGVSKFNGVPFDARGLIQLRGADFSLSAFPVAVTNIPVGLRGSSLHFLHAASHPSPAGTNVAQYVAQYEDGRTAAFNVRYGEHLIDWWSRPERNFRPRDTQSCLVAWSGSNERVKANDPKKLIHLYQAKWTNPRPETKILSLNLISSLAPSGPFIVAITVEP